jgi:hypothetical protein
VSHHILHLPLAMMMTQMSIVCCIWHSFLPQSGEKHCNCLFHMWLLSPKSFNLKLTRKHQKHYSLSSLVPSIKKIKKEVLSIEWQAWW